MKHALRISILLTSAVPFALGALACGITAGFTGGWVWGAEQLEELFDDSELGEKN